MTDTPTRPADRQRTPAELLVDARALHAQLGRALDSLDRNDLGAVRDVAHHVRTAITLEKGAKVIQRLVSAYQLPRPRIRVRPVPTEDAPITTLIGPFPLDDVDVDDDVPRLDLLQWVQEGQAIMLPGRRSMTWNAFLRAFANDRASHISTTVKDELEAMEVYQGTSRNMSEFMVRCAGIVAERALDNALAQIIPDEHKRSPQRSLADGGITIDSIFITTEGRVNFGVKTSIAANARLLRVPIADTTATISIVWEPGAELGRLEVQMDDPGGWQFEMKMGELGKPLRRVPGLTWNRPLPPRR